MLIDSHMHLYYWQDDAVGPLLEKAVQAGVGAVVTLGVTPRTCHRTIQQARAIPMVYAGVGIHPLWVKGEPRADALEAVRAMALTRDRKVRFIGEIGLDARENRENLDFQREVYRQMIRLAKEVDLPINVHCSSAHQENLEILRQEGPPPRGGIIHSFHGTPEQMKAYLDLGMYISMGLQVFGKRDGYEEIVKKTPRERLLLETDATGLGQEGHPGEPADLALIAADVAYLRGITSEKLQLQARENLERLMGPIN